jgi:hypothetical protein
VEDRDAVVTAAEGFPLSRHRTLASAAEWITSREQEPAVNVKAVDPDRPAKLRSLSARDHAALQRVLYPALYDATAGPDAKADAAALRAARLNASNSSPLRLDALDARARASRNP